MWKWVAAIASVPIGAAGIVAAIGLLLPRDHVASLDISLPAGVEETAQMIRNVEDHPRWRRGVRSVRILEQGEGAFRYVETSSHGTILFDFAEETAGTSFRSTIADPDLPFGGYWAFSLRPEGRRTRLRIEEHGFVTNPIFRFVSRFIFGHDGQIRAYAADLQRALEGRKASGCSSGSSA